MGAYQRNIDCITIKPEEGLTETASSINVTQHPEDRIKAALRDGDILTIMECVRNSELLFIQQLDTYKEQILADPAVQTAAQILHQFCLEYIQFCKEHPEEFKIKVYGPTPLNLLSDSLQTAVHIYLEAILSKYRSFNILFNSPLAQRESRKYILNHFMTTTQFPITPFKLESYRGDYVDIELDLYGYQEIAVKL